MSNNTVLILAIGVDEKNGTWLKKSKFSEARVLARAS